VIRNNERGFRCRDLFGICTVGASTKIPQPGGKHFIGRKGIGFKSVFLTTSKPYIFSRELKVYLLDKPTKEIPVAYLVPYWVDGTSQQDKAIMARAYGEESPTQPSRWRDHTVLYLPLNKDHPGVSWLAIESQLLAMQSTIALFINLTTIKFITPTKTFEFVKSTVENETVQIVLLNDKAFAIRSQRISDVPRDKDQPTSDDPEVTVAVPLDPAMMQQTAQSGYLYTYLPTLYVPQLPFLINADFVIPASRERVELTNAWNDRLMIAATTLFVSLYLDLLQDNRIPLATLFCTLPTRTAPEVARYAKMIRKELCGRPTIFCTDAVFRTPMECKIADHHIQTLLHEELEAGDEDLPSIFSGLHFVATKLTEHQVNLDYLTEYFGVTHFTASDWAQLLDSKHSQLSELITSKDDQWICDFLIMLSTLKYATLAQVSTHLWLGLLMEGLFLQ
jgi:sacsin